MTAKPLDRRLHLKRIVRVTLRFHLFIYIFAFAPGGKDMFSFDGTWETLKVLFRSGGRVGGREVRQGEVSWKRSSSSVG